MVMYQVDAFADRVFGGNPAAVVPLEEWISDDLMQQIAIENNLSETAYFVKEGDIYHIRWFTPDFEIDLCGHATLASAFVIKNHFEPEIDVIEFSTQKAGSLKVFCEADQYTLDFPARIPQPTYAPKELFPSLGIDQAVEVLKSRDYFVVLEDEAAVLNVKPDFTLMRRLDAIGVIVTAKGKSAEVVSRCFYPGIGFQEDPVTGSAHCNIIPYWCGKLGKNSFFAKQLSKRGGDLWCELKGDRVLMTGKAVEYMKGTIDPSIFDKSTKTTERKLSATIS
ncbi:MAG TPA: PhzF family phenazine biosynthesis protein [Chitinophagaceae bacterium]|nr:PhzF family phenazine biosynthesis protein [Chitinophagaceae bacterium]